MKVYILGAGASKPDGIPVTQELVDKAFWNFGGPVDGEQNRNLLGTWSKELALSTFRLVFEIFDKFYGTKLVYLLDQYYKTTFHPVTTNVTTDMIEDFFSRIRRLETGESDYGLGLSPEGITNLSRAAKFFFFHTLCYEAIKHPSREHYAKFVNKFLRQEGRHCIISFNYDLLPEDRLIDQCQRLVGGKWVPLDELSWTYCIEFKGIYHKQRYELLPEEKAKILYLKLHGSLNFGYHADTKEVSLYTLYADPWAYRRFDSGEWPDIPLLIPPLKVKEIDIPALKELWRKAEEYLSKATELHVLGYSLPDVDQEAHRLLGGVNGDQLERLVIANPNREHVRRLVSVLKVKPGLVKVYRNFEEYLKG